LADSTPGKDNGPTPVDLAQVRTVLEAEGLPWTTGSTSMSMLTEDQPGQDQPGQVRLVRHLRGAGDRRDDAGDVGGPRQRTPAALQLATDVEVPAIAPTLDPQRLHARRRHRLEAPQPANDRTWSALVLLADQARQTLCRIDDRDETDGLFHEIYLW
jgi:hypothetical protein